MTIETNLFDGRNCNKHSQNIAERSGHIVNHQGSGGGIETHRRRPSDTRDGPIGFHAANAGPLGPLFQTRPVWEDWPRMICPCLLMLDTQLRVNLSNPHSFNLVYFVTIPTGPNAFSTGGFFLLRICWRDRPPVTIHLSTGHHYIHSVPIALAKLHCSQAN